MKKKTSVSADETIAIAVVSFGNDPIPLTLHKGATVADALAAASITLGRQELFVSGTAAEATDELEGGDVLSVVTPKQAGSN